jgi:hypothetical protein
MVVAALFSWLSDCVLGRGKYRCYRLVRSDTGFNMFVL